MAVVKGSRQGKWYILHLLWVFPGSFFSSSMLTNAVRSKSIVRVNVYEVDNFCSVCTDFMLTIVTCTVSVLSLCPFNFLWTLCLYLRWVFAYCLSSDTVVVTVHVTLQGASYPVLILNPNETNWLFKNRYFSHTYLSFWKLFIWFMVYQILCLILVAAGLLDIK